MMRSATCHLPPATCRGPFDDFGDVFGIFYAIIGGDYSFAQLNEVAKMLRRELLLVPYVQKVELSGVQSEVIYVEVSRDRSAPLGISPEEIHAALREQNLVVPSGAVDVGNLRITISPTAGFSSTKDFENPIIRRGGANGTLVYLKDTATARRGFSEPPETLLRYDGKPAIGLGISTVTGGNVVTMGAGVQQRIQNLASEIPLGVKFSQRFNRNSARHFPMP